jgi:peroxiredoxin
MTSEADTDRSSPDARLPRSREGRSVRRRAVCPAASAVPNTAADRTGEDTSLGRVAVSAPGPSHRGCKPLSPAGTDVSDSTVRPVDGAGEGSPRRQRDESRQLTKVGRSGTGHALEEQDRCPDNPSNTMADMVTELVGRSVPSVELQRHEHSSENLRSASTESHLAVLYFYPADKNSPLIDDMAHHRGFRDHLDAFTARECRVIGISTEPVADQAYLVTYQRLTHLLLSDPGLLLARELRLPTYRDSGEWFYQRLALVTRAGVIAHVFFPIQDAARNAVDILAWVAAQQP